MEKEHNSRELEGKIVSIAILTCSCVTQDLACSSYRCFKSAQNRESSFSIYRDKEVHVAGIINCAGCPTIAAPEKILRRVKSLAWLPIDALHISSCMEALCPFKNKYIKVIRERYPELEVVSGTHELGDEKNSDVSNEMVRNMVCGLFRQPAKTMADMTRIAIERGR